MLDLLIKNDKIEAHLVHAQVGGQRCGALFRAR